MPKKKLTKAQVKRKYKAIQNATYDLTLDKMGHADSKVPQSLKAIQDLNMKISNILIKLIRN
jgi:hypothetical protein